MATKSVHSHYIYSLRYNSCSRKVIENIKKCTTKLKTSGLLYKGNTYCIFVLQTANIKKRASTIRKEYLAQEAPLHYILGHTNLEDNMDTYFKKKDLIDIFSRTVCSTESAVATVKDFCEQICSGVGDEERVTFKLSDFKKHMHLLTDNIEQKQREIKDEKPYCRWLYDYVCRILRPKFVVTSQEENIPRFEAYEADHINEYSSLEGDLVIYKAQNVGPTSVECCIVTIQESFQESVDKTVSGLVAELKLHDKTSYPMWECFHNMSAVGAHLAMKRLMQGIVLESYIIYGVVVVARDLRETKLIQLSVDFGKGESNFKVCEQVFDLDSLLNAILAKLDV